jgi:sulfite reductase (NADPH) flavoprotein alpha-component
MNTQTLTPPSPSQVSLVPDNAPFNVEQRAWLNGFFAGMLGAQSAADRSLGSLPVPGTAQPEMSVEPVEEDTPWHDPAISMDERLKLADGRSHPMKLMAAMAQLDCGSCGYICKSYAEAIASGEEKDFTKCTPGGRETSKMLKQLRASAPKSFVAVTDVKVSKSSSATEPRPTGSYDRTNPYSARLLYSQPLNAPGSGKDTRLVAIDLRGSGITYNAGDALGVYPENCPETVGKIIAALGARGSEDVMGWDDQTTSFYDALIRDFTVTRPSPDLLDLLARCATVDTDRDELINLRDGDEGSGDLEILDLLTRFPSARPAPGDFVATLSPLAPRLYSISSSQRMLPDEVHLTVGAVRYKNSIGRSCKGVASNFLAGRIRAGQTLRVFVQPSHRFGLPVDTNKPIIMVGPGTGIAPFRSFLQDRKATGATGRAWLFFGDHKSETDFLYRDELEEYLLGGTLTRLDTAFSRDGDEKVYVQHRMLQNAAEMWKWLQDGAHFYICGDAKRMAADVDKALRRIIAEAGGLSPDETDNYVAELTRSGRYQRDVY